MNKPHSKSYDIAMITMSEAAWERNEERHRREKKNILAVLVVAIALLAITNMCWFAHMI
jgi:hypothetical protein